MKNIINKFIFDKTNSIKKNIAIKIIATFGILKILIILPDLYLIFGEKGLIKDVINDKYTHWYQPTLNWFSEIFKHLGISENTTLLFFTIIFIFSLVCVFMDYRRLFFAIISWFIHLTLTNSTDLLSYGADYLTTFMLFINIFLCASHLFNNTLQTLLYSFAIRFLQIHLCIVYFFAGFGKSLGTTWFDGNAVWNVINTYTSNNIIEYSIVMVEYQIFFKVLGWGTIALELLYPILIFIPRIRKVTLYLIFLMHLSIGIFMEFYIFGLIMILLNIIAFGQYLKWNFLSYPVSENIVPKTSSG